MGWTAFLDACVLYPSSTRDLLLRGADAYLYRVCWSSEVLVEVRRNLVADQRCAPDKANDLIEAMTRAFPEALVTGYEKLVPAMRTDEGDRHVLAAAVTAKADVIVTDNARHFPAEACDPYSIEVQTADEFLSFSFDLAPTRWAGRSCSRSRIGRGLGWTRTRPSRSSTVECRLSPPSFAPYPKCAGPPAADSAPRSGGLGRLGHLSIRRRRSPRRDKATRRRSGSHRRRAPPCARYPASTSPSSSVHRSPARRAT